MEEQIKHYTQLCWDRDLEAKRWQEVRKLWGRYNIDYDEFRSGSKQRDPVALDISRRYANRIYAEAWVIENAVTRGLTITQSLRQLLDFEIDAVSIDTRPSDIPYPYNYLG